MYELKWFDKLRGPSRCQVFLAHMQQNRCSSGVVVYGCSQRSQFVVKVCSMCSGPN